jgi:hypothetical protein
MFIQHLVATTIMALLLLLPGCQQSEPHADDHGSPWDGYEPFVPMDEEPTYHVMEGYDPQWQEYLREGIELSRTYWGSYGPTHVWIVGAEDGDSIDEDASEAFLEEYCNWRTAGTTRTLTECRPHAQRQFLDVLRRGDPEAYLSVVRETDVHMAELVFINVHEWYFEEDVIPDPVLRGIHEYTHVFQQSVGRMPTWMMEGGALFSEAWLPSLDGRRPPEEIMRRIMMIARGIDDPDVSIADMEEIETAPEHVAKYYQELAYYSGAWATVFMVYESPTRSVEALRDTFYPLLSEIGWEEALPRYVGMESTAEFYEQFEAFMDLPIEEQLAILGEIQS